MSDEEKYDYESLIQIIEVVLKITHQNPIPQLSRTIDSTIKNKKYYYEKVYYYSELFILRIKYNFEALNLLFPYFKNNPEILYPINLIMRNLITDFLTGSYLFTIHYQCDESNEFSNLDEVIGNLNAKAIEFALENDEKDPRLTNQILYYHFPHNLKKEDLSKIKRNPLNPSHIIKKIEHENKTTINDYFNSYNNYFSKFEHFSDLFPLLIYKKNPYPDHCNAVMAGANQIVNCYRFLEKSIEDDKLLELIKRLTN